MNRYDKIHDANIRRYMRELRAIYLSIIRQVSEMTVGLSNMEYAFRNHPELNRKVNELIRAMHGEVYTLTVSGIHSEWAVGNDKHLALFNLAFGKKANRLPQLAINKYLAPNIAARDAFVGRLENGMNLSERIWRNTNQLKQELELALEFAVSRGQSAKTTAIQIGRYLNNPIKLRENVQTRFGEQRLLDAVDVSRPKAGMYKSSYKNALRLTRNETNFAYETSQYLRRQQQDFVVGIDISVAPNYDRALDKGGIVCADLQGRYPKDFDFSQKWHVNCRCVATSILKTRQELDLDAERILSGGDPSTESVNTVKDVSNMGYINEVREMTKSWKRKPIWLTNLN